MIKRGLFIFSFLFLAVVSIGLSGAVSYSLTDVNSTLATISVSGADSLYAYEVNLSYTGTVNSVSFYPFLSVSGDTAYTSGYNTRGSFLYAYSSRLDKNKQSVSGSGALFNVTHSGSLSLSGAVAAATTGTETYTNLVTGEEIVVETEDEGDTGGSGGSGGASISVNTSGVDVAISPDSFDINALSGVDTYREFKIKNTGTKAVTLSISKESLEDSISVDSSVSLDAGEEKALNLTIHSIRKGVIAGKIVFKYYGNAVAELPLVINMRSDNFLFDSVITLADKKLLSGEKLKAEINLMQVGPKEKVDVSATYIIKDFSGNTYFEETETFYVLDSKNYIKEFSTSDLPTGSYIVGLEIVYPGAFATSSAQFQIVENTSIFDSKIIFILFGIIAGAGIIFVIWAVVGRKKIRYKR